MVRNIGAHQLSLNAAAVLKWLEANQLDNAYRVVRDRRLSVIALNWDGIARALGYAAYCRESFRHAQAALKELREAGRVFYYDEGAGTFGHETLCLVPR